MSREHKTNPLPLALALLFLLSACSGGSPSPSPSRSRSPSPSPSPSQVVDTARAAAVEDLQGDVTATQSGDTFAAFTGLALQNSDTLATG
ncbi:MAG: hypothetical protein LBI44_07950, partial [Oscillospiraceae bacterium]|nr:hypothetical protein [Oscillospiraceae bacterium]